MQKSKYKSRPAPVMATMETPPATEEIAQETKNLLSTRPSSPGPRAAMLAIVMGLLAVAALWLLPAHLRSPALEWALLAGSIVAGVVASIAIVRAEAGLDRGA